MGQGRRKVDKQGFKSQVIRISTVPKTQGKRVEGKSVQTGSTTRNPIKHITIINKECPRLGTTGGGVQIINTRHTESKTLNETYRIRRTTGNRWRETGTIARPDQTRPINTKQDRELSGNRQKAGNIQKAYRTKDLAWSNVLCGLFIHWGIKHYMWDYGK